MNNFNSIGTMMKNLIPPGKARAEIQTGRRTQRGVVLFVALIILVAMSLAGIGMMRAVDAGTQIAGNLAFRQSAIHAAEAAFEEAIKTIRLASLNGTASASGTVAGYSSLYQAEDFVAKRDWAAAVDLGVDAKTGNQVHILIDRICDVDESCAATRGYLSQAIGSSMGGGVPIEPYSAHFRVTARVTNTRNMVTYVEEKFY